MTAAEEHLMAWLRDARAMEEQSATVSGAAIIVGSGLSVLYLERQAARRSATPSP